MMKKWMAVFALGLLAGGAWAQEAPYFRPFMSGASDFKIAALRELVSPETKMSALSWSSDPRIQELVGLAQATDILLYDGMRLVRYRGVLVTEGGIDNDAIERAVYFFNVTPQEAKAWLLASRLMQIAEFKDDGAALAALEYDLLETAKDMYLRLATYVGPSQALSCMPRVANLWKAQAVGVMAPVPAPEKKFTPSFAPQEMKQKPYRLIRMPR